VICYYIYGGLRRKWISFLLLTPETNLAKCEAAQAFRNTYIVFFLIGSFILAILGSASAMLPGTKEKNPAKKKASARKKVNKKSKR
jgi:hypothetical protein